MHDRTRVEWLIPVESTFLNYLHEMITSDLSGGRDRDDSTRLVSTALTNPLDLPTLEHVLEIARAIP